MNGIARNPDLCTINSCPNKMGGRRITPCPICEHQSKPKDTIESLQQQLKASESHMANAVDNLNDLPINDEWAKRWAAKAEEILGIKEPL